MPDTENGEIIIHINNIADVIPYLVVFIVAFLLGNIFCLTLLKKKYQQNKQKPKDQQDQHQNDSRLVTFMKKCNMENIVFAISIFLVAISIILQCVGTFNGFSTIVINIFGTLIVSWIATKKNSEEEAKRKEQMIAKKSRRYLKSIKTIATNAIKILSDSIEKNSEEYSTQQLLILERAKDQMEHIETGIETSLFDWEDMMSQEDIITAHSGDDIAQKKLEAALSTVPDFNKEKFESSEQINQEEA